jgi:hypothetical protein
MTDTALWNSFSGYLKNFGKYDFEHSVDALLSLRASIFHTSNGGNYVTQSSELLKKGETPATG